MLIRGSALVLKFALSFYLARYLGLPVLGLYGLVVGATMVIPTLVRAGMTSSITRALVNAPPAQMVDTVQHYLAWVAACYAAALAVLMGADAMGWTDTLPFNGYGVWLVVVAEHVAADLFLLLGNLYKAQSANLFGLVQTAAWVLPFGVLSYLVPSLRNLDALLALWALGTVCAVLLFALELRSWPWRERAPLRPHWYPTHLRASAYLYLSDLSGTLAQFIDRYLIAVFIDIEHAGVYTLFFQLANALYTLVSSSIVNLHRPAVLSAFQKSQTQEATALLRAMQWRAIGTMLVVALAVGLAFQWLAPLLQRPLVLQYLPLMWLTFAATAVKIACLTSFVALFAMRLDGHLFGLNVMILVLVVGGSLVLLPATGIYGIPLATGLAYLVTLYGIHHTVRTQTQRAVP